MRVNSPYFHVQAIRRMYRDQGIFTSAKPFTYGINIDFAVPGAAAINEQARDTLKIDADSDFVWIKSQWYAQDVPFAKQSISNNAEDSTWETVRTSLFRFRFRLLPNTRALHQDAFIDGVMFGGWSGVESFNVGLSQDDINRTDVTPDAARDVGIGNFSHPFLEPVVLPASSSVEVTMLSRANNTSSTHVIAFHGVKLFRHH